MARIDSFIQCIRSSVGVFVGLMLISLVAEGIEFLLVALVHGSVTTDQDVYFGIRNRPAILAGKFVYNNFAAFAGGYAAAWIAGRAPVWHGLVVALVQLAGLVYGMTASPYASTTPRWAWLGLCLSMTPITVIGSRLGRRKSPSSKSLITAAESRLKRPFEIVIGMTPILLLR